MSHVRQQIRDRVATLVTGLPTTGANVYKMRRYAVSDSIDTICVSAEEAIAADFTLNGLAKSCILTSTEIDINVEGEKSIASARLVYTVEYITSITDVETAR
jgi:hypothetical protein